MLVSHDERLISLVADELWVVKKGKNGLPGSVAVFQGDFDAYRQKLQVSARTSLGGCCCCCCAKMLYLPFFVPSFLITNKLLIAVYAL